MSAGVHPTAVIDVVGLTADLIGPHAPHLASLVREGDVRRIRPSLPAVTTTVQSSMLTGVTPASHGIVANGWYERDLAEVRFWKQSNRIVSAEKVWEIARRRDPSVTCANVFWWFNMHSSADWSVTPRPIYKADGRKLPDVYTHPGELRHVLQAELGRFPLFRFWGPASDIVSSRWIADAAVIIHERHEPSLLLVYLPHLDYALQRHGPGAPEITAEVMRIDRVVADLTGYLESAGVRTIVLSEYGIDAVSRPVHINRALRSAGGVAIRVEDGLELLDPGASAAFAVADHQVAHVYVADPADIGRYAGACRELDGVEQVLDRAGQAAAGIDHPRSGDLVLVAEPDAWFTYYYWLDDARAPDFARTVDIHRKPGYDPVELFLDPSIRFPKLAIARRLLRSRLGFRQLMDVIPLDATLVRGSHGRTCGASSPILITPRGLVERHGEEISDTGVRDVILEVMGLS